MRATRLQRRPAIDPDRESVHDRLRDHTRQWRAPPPTFTISNAGNVTEGNKPVFTVNMSGSISAPVTIWDFDTRGHRVGGSRGLLRHVRQLPLTFNPGGATSQQIVIPTLVEPGNPVESAETFSVGLQ